MSDLGSNELEYKAHGGCEYAKARIAELESANAELERREALLTALVHAEDAMWKHDAECDGEDAEACQPFGAALVDARAAIDWIPRS
jgi:hypothetical protein